MDSDSLFAMRDRFLGNHRDGDHNKYPATKRKVSRACFINVFGFKTGTL